MVLVTSIFAAYSNVYDMRYVYDDEFYIQKNEFLNSFTNTGKIFSTNATAGSGFQDSFYRPMQFFFYLVTAQTLGSHEWSFHFLNVFLHVINALLLFFLSQIIGFKKEGAFAVALLWGLHPIHTEAISYISGTADPLQFFFIFLSLIVFFKKPKGSVAASSFLFMCAFLSKEVAIVFPGLLFALIFLMEDNRWKLKTYLPAFGFLAMALVYVGMRATVLDFNGDFHFYKTENIYTQNMHFRAFTFLATLPKYFMLLIYPHDQHIDRAFPVYVDFFSMDVLVGFTMILALLFSCCFLLYKRSESGIFLTAMALWFFAAHSLHSGIIVPMNSLFLEHWLYVPSVAVLWGGVYFLQKAPLKFALPLVGTVALVFATLTYRQNRMWESPITLFSSILQWNPKATRVRHNLAMAYSEQGQDDLAQKEYETVLSNDERPYPQTYHNLALIYLKRNRIDEGEKLLLKAIEISPKFHPSYEYLIRLYEFKNEPNKVREWTEKKSQLN
jgi:protein O-mannosyl-transferase